MMAHLYPRPQAPAPVSPQAPAKPPRCAYGVSGRAEPTPQDAGTGCGAAPELQAKHAVDVGHARGAGGEALLHAARAWKRRAVASEVCNRNTD